MYGLFIYWLTRFLFKETRVAYGRWRRSRQLDLIDALSLGDTSYIQSWLNKGGNPNTMVWKDAFCTPALSIAVVRKQAEVAKLLLEHGAKPDGRNSKGFTALSVAVEKDWAPGVELLVKAGADSLQRVTASHCRRTPMFSYALSARGHAAANALLRLMAEGWDQHAPPLNCGWVEYSMRPDGNRRTAMHYAAATDCASLIATLIEEGANPNVVDKLGMTPLHLACYNGSLDAGRALVGRSQVKLTLADRSGRSALDTLHKKLPGPKDESYPAFIALREALLEAGGLYLKDVSLQPRLSPLMDAIRRNDVAQLRSGLAGFKVDQAQIDIRGQETTLLVYAVERRHLECVDALLKAGANPNSATSAGVTPLLAALNAANMAVLTHLLSAGADAAELVTVPGDREYWWGADGDPLLVVAARLEREDMALLLLDRGADPRAANRRGITALHHAALNNMEELCRRLIAGGADVNALTADGTTPLALAAYDIAPPVCGLLLDAGADPDIPRRLSYGESRPPLSTAITSSSVSAEEGSAFSMLLAATRNVNARDEDGETALHYAARGPRRELVEALLAKGADPRLVTRGGHTPLHLAAHFGQGKLFDLLATSEAVNALDREGLTPLDILIEASPADPDEVPFFRNAEQVLRNVLGGKRAQEL